MTKVYIYPDFGGPDKADGGIRRVVEAQRRLLPSFGIDVVDNPEAADVLASHIMGPRDFYSRYARKPLVAHNHGFYWRDYPWSGDWARKANREVMNLVKYADLVTAPSEWVAAIIRRHTCRRVLVIPHGVDIPFAIDNPEGPIATDVAGPRGGYVLWNKTRVDPVCDPEAVRELAARLPGVAFKTTFWESDPPGPLQGAVPANVDVVGAQPYEQARLLVQGAGVYLATSRETFGIGMLEAMAAGVPVVGWDYAGQREIVHHRRDGYLARAGDYDDLAIGVRWALEYRDRLGARARETATEYSWDGPIEHYATLYHELAEQQQSGEPRVSIIVTAHMVAPYLDAALTSVHTQSAADWECIVVDDASPDESLEIATTWAATDKRFRVIHNEVNVNTPEARNIGCRAARGRYLLPLDGDDELTPDAVGLLADALDADRTIAVAYGNLVFHRADGAEAHSGWPVEFDLGRFFTGPGQPMPYSSMMRRDAWELTGGYRRRVRSSEDCDLWMRLASYGFDARMVTRADTLRYRIREGSRSDTEGHRDAENKAWFPWRTQPALAPAGAGNRPLLEVPALEPARVSVVIACGPGHEKYVQTAVDSVDGQIYREWECIVVNDTGGALPELPTWVRIVCPDLKSVGVAEARNAGIAAARAPLFICLDADDYLAPDALLVMLAAHLQNKDGRDVVFADFWEDPDTAGVFKPYELADYDANLLLSKGSWPAMALTPRAAWEEVGGYTANVPWEDWDFQLKLAAAGWCGQRVPRPLWVYRKHTGTRRADHARRKTAAEKVFQQRWGDYISGEKVLMACTACGGRSKLAMRLESRAPGPGTAAAVSPAASAVRIRFTGEQRGSLPMPGPVTRTMYYFSASDPVKYVLAADAPGFLEKRFFEVVDPVELAPAPSQEYAPAGVQAAPAPMVAYEDNPGRRPAATPTVRHVVDTRPDGPVTQPFDASAKPKTIADLPPEMTEPPPPAPSEAPLPPPPED
jgi:glycosyltransferase involved in cell wall biosynthesis